MSAVTWLLPVRDGLPFLAEALASIERQTFRDFTVLAWDNGSSDGSAELLRQWVPARLPGRVVVGQPYPTLGGSLRRMVEEAGSELLARADADDVSEPQRLERQVAFLRANPAVAAVGSATRTIDASGAVSRTWRPPCGRGAVRWSMFFANQLAHPAVVARRDAVLRAGSYAEIPYGEDYDLWVRMLSVGSLANLREPLLRYRRHDRNMSARAAESWTAFDRDIARRLVGVLFAGLDHDRCMRVWELARGLAPDAAGAVPTGDVWAMARRVASAEGEWPLALLGTPALHGLLLRTVPTGGQERALVALARALRALHPWAERGRRGIERRLRRPGRP